MNRDILLETAQILLGEMIGEVGGGGIDLGQGREEIRDLGLRAIRDRVEIAGGKEVRVREKIAEKFGGGTEVLAQEV